VGIFRIPRDSPSCTSSASASLSLVSAMHMLRLEVHIAVLRPVRPGEADTAW
jgi:hypothetical protein